MFVTWPAWPAVDGMTAREVAASASCCCRRKPQRSEQIRAGSEKLVLKTGQCCYTIEHLLGLLDS